MKTDAATALARAAMNKHGLQNWNLRLDRARQRCGSCHFAKQEITLSRHFVALNESDEVQATILHEIAHALAGPRAGHGRRWQKIAAQLGARVDATNASAAMPEPPWGLRCSNCRQIVARRHRRSLKLSRVRCRACGEHRGALQWERSPTP